MLRQWLDVAPELPRYRQHGLAEQATRDETRTLQESASASIVVDM
jgi:hypothetical protein